MLFQINFYLTTILGWTEEHNCTGYSGAEQRYRTCYSRIAKVKGLARVGQRKRQLVIEGQRE